MKQKLRIFLTVAAALCLAVFLGTQSVFASENNDAKPMEFFSAPSVTVADTSYKTYYYDQLGKESKLIYDALLKEENLALLKSGKEISVGEAFRISVPLSPSQSEYGTLLAAFTEKQNACADLMDHVTDAIAAFDRDHSEIFWTSGVQSYVRIKENGSVVSGTYSFGFGNEYEVVLAIKLSPVEEWDGDGLNDRSLEEDIALLEENILALANGARAAANNRYGQLQYINAQLKQYNAYNTAAASGGSGGYGYHYPWTALSALDQLTAENDAGNSLRPVCEGYARALKLICNELGIPSILVSGKGGNEPHMWNYVQMDDGKWYAMDVTWNDSTENDGYFLVGKSVMNQKHEESWQIMTSGQTVQFVYPTLSASSYVFLNPHSFNVNSLADRSATYGDTVSLPSVSSSTADELVWETTDPTVAYVNNTTGTLVIVGAGEARLTVTAKANANYSASSLSFVLRIAPKEITLEGIEALDRSYNGTNKVTLQGGKLVGIVKDGEVSVMIPATGSISSPNASGTPYSVSLEKPVLTGENARSYVLKELEPLTVKISPAEVIVTAKDQSVTMGDSDLSINIRYEIQGLIGTDQLTGVNVSYWQNGKQVQSFSEGIYDIVLTAEAGSNYLVKTENGKLTVLPKPHTHQYGEWTVVKKAEVGVDGLREKSCACGDKITEIIPSKETVKTQADDEERKEPASDFDSIKRSAESPKLLYVAGGAAGLVVLIGLIAIVVSKKRR